ncbi:Protein CBG06305 [Caenorhabditis briggsae]|uniref:Serpentine Receptor, class H n=2 Tax=Caenorhabditis briggsae TaxID=6238 RepID=A0AAE9D0I7_CAEBR|nr:Protein CBG06305 [Caenorhabditis briggsae]ULT87819.1 hypothetical protein L3Y34_007180 [Caenorhabditis briggsae]CAP26632.1 Protein CBG06305 [Caenorhabditis briggsae]
MSSGYWPDYVESSCRENYTYFDSGDFLQTAYHLTALFTIPLSIFTFYTIIRVTPKKMKNMKIPLLIAHIWGTNLDLCFTVYGAPYIFFPGAAGLSLGIFRALGFASKWVAYIGQASIVAVAINFIMLLENRHSQIPLSNFKITNHKVRTAFLTINYLFAFLYILPFYLDKDNQMEIRKFVLKRIPCPTIEFFNKQTVVLLKGGEFLPFLSMVVGLIIVLSQTLFFSIHTVYHLNFVKGANVSEATKAMQRKFLSYVVMQMLIPWTVLAGPIFYSLYADRHDYYNQAFNNFSMLFMALHGLLSNSCTLFIIKPYREFVKNLITGNSEFNSREIAHTTNAAPVSVVVGSTSG